MQLVVKALVETLENTFPNTPVYLVRDETGVKLPSIVVQVVDVRHRMQLPVSVSPGHGSNRTTRITFQVHYLVAISQLPRFAALDRVQERLRSIQYLAHGVYQFHVLNPEVEINRDNVVWQFDVEYREFDPTDDLAMQRGQVHVKPRG